MKTLFSLLVLLIFALPSSAQNTITETTRINDEAQHARKGAKSYPFREWSEYIISELDIHPTDSVLDIGSGDGWWIDEFIKHGTDKATYYALEVEEDKVNKLKEKYINKPFVKPVLAPKTGTGIDKNSIDLAFFSQVYHHLPEDGHVEYLKHLKSVVKPTGRIAIIERYSTIAVYSQDHGTQLGMLIQQGEEAGWIPLRYQIIPNTNHYLVILGQKELFRLEKDFEEPKELTHTTDTVADIKEAVKNGKALIIDVRELNEWEDGHLTDAQLLPMSTLNKIKEDENAMNQAKEVLGENKIIYTHCRRGGRALTAGKLLQQYGYDVRPLGLGFEALVKEGLEQAK